MRRLFVIVAIASWMGCKSGTEGKEGSEPKGATMKLSSSAFSHSKTIPKMYTGDGADVSPPLAWEGVPQGTQSFVLIMDDPDAPVGTWDHWLVYNLAADLRELGEGAVLPKDALDGTNSWGRTGYGGPSPPPGKPHRYFFKLYALSAPLTLAAGAKKGALLAAMEGKILAKSEWVGTYGRE